MPVRRSIHHGSRGALTLALALVAAMAVALPGLANHDTGPSAVFEGGDGDLAPTAGHVDWNSFTDSTLAADWNLARFTDRTGNPDDIFGGGVKQDDPCPPTTEGSMGGGNGKFDLERIYLANQTVNDAVYLALAWVRVPSSPTSSSHVAYEFNKGTAGFCGGATPPATQTEGLPLLNRVAGDLLVVYDFTGGSADASIKIATWLTDPSASCEVSQSTPPCWGNVQDLTADGYAHAKVNNPEVTDKKTGSTTGVGTVTDAISPDGPEDLTPVRFGEAILNLSAAGVFGSTSCDGFGFVTAVSRSSGNSGIAQMKDKVGTNRFNLAPCEGSILVEKVDETGTRLPDAGFTVTNGVNLPMVEYADGVFCIGGLAYGSYTVTETTTPPGYVGADPETVVVSSESTCADRIDADGLPIGTVDASFENTPQPGSVEITKTDDDDNPLVGVTFNLYADDGQGEPTGNSLGSCTTDASGECTIENVDPGDYCVTEDPTTVPTDYTPSGTPECFTVYIAEDGDLVEISFVNPRKHKVIVIVCHEGTNTLAASDVTIDGTDITTLAQGSANQALLCALDGVGGFEHEEIDVTVDVGSDAH